MTVKQLIEKLQEYNLNAEVRILLDRKTGDTGIASIIRELDEDPRYFGFAGAALAAAQSKNKKKYKKVVIA